MSTINWDNFKCRCSSIDKAFAKSKSNPVLTEKQEKEFNELEKIAHILTETQSKRFAELLLKKENGSKIILSDTYIEYLMEYYSWATTGKKAVSKEAIYLQFVEKGKEVENDSILLLSQVEGLNYSKNEQRVENKYLSGIPDVFVGEEIMKATKISDLKSVWDYPGFLKKVNQGIETKYDRQVKGYMDITGAPEGEIAYCLVDTPLWQQKDFHDLLLRKMNVISDESPAFRNEWEIIERSMTFEDIPKHKRVFKQKVEPFSDFDRNYLYDRVKIGREWLWKFDEMYQNLNK